MPWPHRDQASSLAQRAARGDRAAFRDLYRELFPVVRRFVARRVASSADADDLVSKVFHKLVENVSSFDRRKASAKTWVLAMARNAVIDHYRTRKHAVSVDELADGLGDGAGGPLQALIDDEEVRAVGQLLETCAPEVRAMLSLRYGDGLKHREIAELMGLSEAAVKQRLSRAIREMRTRSEVFSRRTEVDYAV